MPSNPVPGFTIYKPSSRSRSNDPWLVTYRTEHGKRRTRSISIDYDLAVEWAVKERRRVERITLGLDDPAPAASDSRPLAEIVQEFKQVLLARGCTAKHADDTHKRIQRVMQAGQITLFAHLTESAVQRAVGALRAEGLSVATCNYHLRDCRSLCAWMLRNRKAAFNPLLALSKIRDDGGTLKRRPFSEAELAQLMAAAIAGPRCYGMRGIERAVLYLLAATTGLRSAVLRQLRPLDLVLDGPEPHVIVALAIDKARKGRRQPLRSDVTSILAGYAAGRPVGAPLLPMPSPSNVVRMLRKDLLAAGVDLVTEAGELVFHSFRHTFVSRFARAGVAPKLAQGLAGHSTIRMTMDVYAHATKPEEVAALNSLPELPGCQLLAERTRAISDVSMGRGGIEPPTHGFSVHAPVSPNPLNIRDLREGEQPLSAPGLAPAPYTEVHDAPGTLSVR